MIIEVHPHFRKAYKLRIANNRRLVKLTSQKLALFQENPTQPQLRDHALRGKLSFVRAFWVTREIRIVYARIAPEHVLLLDIGTHEQVY